MTPVICTAGLAKTFRRMTALRSLDLEVSEGSIYAFVGPNGAGKTTTIQLLMNIMRPTAGSCEILGVESPLLGPKELARIGYVSESQEMPNWMTVGYFLRFLRPFYPTWDTSLEAELLKQFELPPDRKLGQLSRGMRMKAALASSLAYRPSLLILDEPFSGLDPLVRDEFIQGLLTRAAGTTIFISSHDLAEIESFASHIGYLDSGVLRFSEELESLNARFRDVVLTFDAPVAAPDAWPADWLQPQASGSVVRFIDSQYQEERTGAEIARVFQQHARISVTPVPLRSIFVSLAKSSKPVAA